MSDGVFAVEYPRDLFERRAFGFDVEEVDESELDTDPALRGLVNAMLGRLRGLFVTYGVEEFEVPEMREVFERNGVGFAGCTCQCRLLSVCL